MMLIMLVIVEFTPIDPFITHYDFGQFGIGKMFFIDSGSVPMLYTALFAVIPHCFFHGFPLSLD